MKQTYTIKIQPVNNPENTYQVQFNTDKIKDIDWCMEQYQRNREPFYWEIVTVRDYVEVEEE
tara:strand:+ start:287 stop:472 length:186 start_codon:yes stop_codon:yes gene_type:complete